MVAKAVTPAGIAQNVSRNRRRDSDGCGLHCAEWKASAEADINGIASIKLDAICVKASAISSCRKARVIS